MSKKMITITAPGGILLSAAAMGTPADVRVGPHEPIDVPEDYANHLISDRFAIPAEKPKSEKPKAGKGGQGNRDQTALIAAEKAVAEAKAKVEAAGDDLAAKAEAEQEPASAEAELQSLQA